MINLPIEQLIIKLECEGIKCVQQYLVEHPEAGIVGAILFVFASGAIYLWRKLK